MTGGSSPCKKRKLHHTEAKESNESVKNEEEAKLPENGTAFGDEKRSWRQTQSWAAVQFRLKRQE